MLFLNLGFLCFIFSEYLSLFTVPLLLLNLNRRFNAYKFKYSVQFYDCKLKGEPSKNNAIVLCMVLLAVVSGKSVLHLMWD